MCTLSVENLLIMTTDTTQNTENSKAFASVSSYKSEQRLLPHLIVPLGTRGSNGRLTLLSAYYVPALCLLLSLSRCHNVGFKVII